MDEERFERALRQGPPLATHYVARPFALDDVGRRRPASAGRLVLLVAVTALLLAGMLAGIAAMGALRDDAPGPDPAPVIVIEGLDGQAFMDTLEEGAGPGLVCGEPQPVTASLQQWSCAEIREYIWEVTIRGESLSTIQSIGASVTHAATLGGPDPGRAAGFLSWVAESATFTGADPVAAGAWVNENWQTESINREASGVAYLLRGSPLEPRSLLIMPSGRATPFQAPNPAPPCSGAFSQSTELDEVPRGPLDAGTYTCYGVGEGQSNAQFTVPEGWEWHGSYLSKGGLNSPEEARISFFTGDVQVYTDPCQWSGAEPDPRTGRAVTDLMAALAAQPMRSATTPAARQADGLESPNGWDGMAVELTVPDDLKFADCDGGQFRSWGPEHNARSHYGPGQRDLVWAVDLQGNGVGVGGERLIIDAASLSGTPASVMAEMAVILESIVVGHLG